MSENYVKVSIVVPIFNEEKNLHRCLDSIRNQTFSDISVILVDDGSVDNSKKICNEYVNNDERFSYYYKKNGGLADARNYGMQYVVSPYVCFIDSDDWVEPTYIEKLLNAIESKDNTDLAICGYGRDYGDSITPFVSKTKFTDTRSDLIINLLDASSYSNAAWNKIYKVSVIKKNDLLFNPKYSIGEDLGFSIDYALKTKSSIYVTDVLYHYMMNPNSMMHKMKSDTTFNKKWLKEWDAICDSKNKCMDENENVIRAFEERQLSIGLKLLTLMKKCNYSTDNYTKEITSFIKVHKKKYLSLRYIRISKKRLFEGIKAYIYYRKHI